MGPPKLSLFKILKPEQRFTSNFFWWLLKYCLDPKNLRAYNFRWIQRPLWSQFLSIQKRRWCIWWQSTQITGDLVVVLHRSSGYLFTTMYLETLFRRWLIDNSKLYSFYVQIFLFTFKPPTISKKAVYSIAALIVNSPKAVKV